MDATLPFGCLRLLGSLRRARPINDTKTDNASSGR